MREDEDKQRKTKTKTGQGEREEEKEKFAGADEKGEDVAHFSLPISADLFFNINQVNRNPMLYEINVNATAGNPILSERNPILSERNVNDPAGR